MLITSLCSANCHYVLHLVLYTLLVSLNYLKVAYLHMVYYYFITVLQTVYTYNYKHRYYST